MLWKILIAFLRFFRLQNAIVIEMERGTRPNTEAVLREMLARKWNQKYLFVLVSDCPEKIAFLKAKHIKIIHQPVTAKIDWKRIKFTWYKLRAVLILDENRQLKKFNPSTVRVFLTHGSPAKSLKKYYNCRPDADYMLNQSEFWKPINAAEFVIDEKKLVTLGYPRNDGLFGRRVDVKGLFETPCRKIVVWYPTYRQHSTDRSEGHYRGSMGIPVIHDEDTALRINDLARKYDVLLVIKPHPSQDLSYIRNLSLDHIVFIDDDFLWDHGIQSYPFLAGTDALITDYSSVFFDYLLTQKPIALTFEDYELYAEQVGFAIDMDIMRSCSYMLDSADDFDQFFRRLVEGDDPLRKKREEIMRLTNQYTDGNSTQRVVDWLETLLPCGTGK